jgi:protocatechuate 3,4-dioxygenase beta subunit
MHNDDEPVGRVLSRRRALALMGFGGAGIATAVGGGIAQASTGTSSASSAGAGSAGGFGLVDCVAKPEMVEGPYFVDERLNRSDIRVEPSDGSKVAGTAFALRIGVAQLTDGRCRPLSGATVDIWQCDVAGLYSGIAGEGTSGKQFLRGYQVTNAAGKAQFVTVLPGWYTRRTVHIHIKIQTIGTDGNAYEFTSQLFLPDDFTAAYLATGPYAAKGPADTTNSTDRFYGTVGDQMLLRPVRHGRDGNTADFTIALDLSDTEVGDDDSFQLPAG